MNAKPVIILSALTLVLVLLLGWYLALYPSAGITVATVLASIAAVIRAIAGSPPFHGTDDQD